MRLQGQMQQGWARMAWCGVLGVVTASLFMWILPLLEATPARGPVSNATSAPLVVASNISYPSANASSRRRLCHDYHLLLVENNGKCDVPVFCEPGRDVADCLCHTARAPAASGWTASVLPETGLPDPCFEHAQWASGRGIVTHPHWFPAQLQVHHTFEDFQCVLSTDQGLTACSYQPCKPPCSPDVSPIGDCVRGTYNCSAWHTDAQAEEYADGAAVAHAGGAVLHTQNGSVAHAHNHSARPVLNNTLCVSENSGTAPPVVMSLLRSADCLPPPTWTPPHLGPIVNGSQILRTPLVTDYLSWMFTHDNPRWLARRAYENAQEASSTAALQGLAAASQNDTDVGGVAAVNVSVTTRRRHSFVGQCLSVCLSACLNACLRTCIHACEAAWVLNTTVIPEPEPEPEPPVYTACLRNAMVWNGTHVVLGGCLFGNGTDCEAANGTGLVDSSSGVWCEHNTLPEPLPQPEPVLDLRCAVNTCEYKLDGICDDGSQGGVAYCEELTDCVDCGNLVCYPDFCAYDDTNRVGCCPTAPEPEPGPELPPPRPQPPQPPVSILERLRRFTEAVALPTFLVCLTLVPLGAGFHRRRRPVPPWLSRCCCERPRLTMDETAQEMRKPVSAVSTCFSKSERR
jgi:hypothetical protein